MFQQTLANSVILEGVGLHSGKPVGITIHPAPVGSGIVFVRIDVTEKNNIIPAMWDRVIDTKLCTIISNTEGVSVSTIEHIMAALHGCGIDNARLDINGPEVPILDGSSDPFVKAIDKVGVVPQNQKRRVIRILKTIRIEEDDKVVELKPSDESSFSFEINFVHPKIGHQTFQTTMMNGNFRHDVAEARTFGFAHEVEFMRKNGLALGGSLDNAIVLDADKIMNVEGLRFENEFVRHKTLDAVGDMYLAGAPILGAYEGFKAGHAMNNAALRKLFETEGAWELVDQA